MSGFENAAYRYHSCGCYRRGVTRIDARGSDLCEDHAAAAACERYGKFEDKYWLVVVALMIALCWLAAHIAVKP